MLGFQELDSFTGGGWGERLGRMGIFCAPIGAPGSSHAPRRSMSSQDISQGRDFTGGGLLGVLGACNQALMRALGRHLSSHTFSQGDRESLGEPRRAWESPAESR